MQDYRNLRVWRKAHSLVLRVRRASCRFPRTGYASLKSQIVRAAESIPFNIVEGCSATSQRDFARFLEISIKSCSELEYQLRLAHDYGILSLNNWLALTTEVIDVRRMLCGLRAKVLAPEQTDSGNAATEKRSTLNALTDSPSGEPSKSS